MCCVLLACAMGWSAPFNSPLGLGLSLWVGLPWTTITPVIIFLALGLGIDNMVLITIMYYRGDKRKTVTQRIVHGGACFL